MSTYNKIITDKDIANGSQAGIVNPVTKTDGMTQAVGADANGRLYTTPAGLSGDYIPTAEKGAANGVAQLDSTGKVPSSQLPSYEGDVLEYSSKSAFPATGESGKIYVAKDTNLTYRWSDSAYAEISPSLALGETESTAYSGAKGKKNAENIATLKAETNTLKAKTAYYISNLVVGTDTIDITIDQPKPFADTSWADIIALADSGNIPDIWKVGDEKDIELSTGETITMQIIGFNHDDLADGSGKAHLTLFMKNSLATTYNMNSSGTNAGGWRDSVMRGRMETFYEYLPEELRAGIKEVTKKTALPVSEHTVIDTTDKLFLLSHVEVMGTNKDNKTSANLSAAGEGSQYDYFKQAQIPEGSSPMISGATAGTFISTGSYVNRFGETKQQDSGDYVNYNNTHALGNSSTSADFWWLRSPHYSNSTTFCFVYNGDIYRSSVGNTYGLSFGFCI